MNLSKTFQTPWHTQQTCHFSKCFLCTVQPKSWNLLELEVLCLTLALLTEWSWFVFKSIVAYFFERKPNFLSSKQLGVIFQFGVTGTALERCKSANCTVNLRTFIRHTSFDFAISRQGWIECTKFHWQDWKYFVFQGTVGHVTNYTLVNQATEVVQLCYHRNFGCFVNPMCNGLYNQFQLFLIGFWTWLGKHFICPCMNYVCTVNLRL